MRALAILMIAAVLLPVTSGAVLVNTKRYPSEILPQGETLTLDLQEFFQVYEGDGPVMTMSISMPVEKGFKPMFTEVVAGWSAAPDDKASPIMDEDSNQLEIMEYELQSGDSYDSPWEIFADELVWETETLEFQMLPENAPKTVANFITYANRGDFDFTHINRMLDQDTKLIQAGGFKFIEDADYWPPLSYVEPMSSIDLEAGLEHNRGTMAAARGQFANSAQNQFFINLTDNSEVLADQAGTQWTDAYAVFAEHLSGNLEILDRVTNTIAFNLDDSNGPSIWDGSGVFSSVPFITPYGQYGTDRDSWVHFNEVSVSEGSNPEGVAYEWNFITPEEPEEDEEPAEDPNTPDSYQINTDNELNQLNVTSVGEGLASIKVSASHNDNTANFEILIRTPHKNITDFLGRDLQYDQGGLIESDWYSWIDPGAAPYVFHITHNWQYLPKTSGEAGSNHFVYDTRLGWWYTTPSTYPVLYSYREEAWLRYLEVSGTQDPRNDGRWFYNYKTKTWVVSDGETLNVPE